MTEPPLSPAATDIPALVVAAASDLLGDADLSPATDFFSAGGDSMIAMHLVSRIARATGLRLRVRLLIANPVLGDFAAEVSALAAAAGDGDPVAAASAG